MTVATTARAAFLKSAESSEIASSATLLARWGAGAGDTAQSSALVNKADATAEAARQLALLASVMATDQIELAGVFFDLEGETVRVSYAMPGGGTFFGSAATVDVLVTKCRPSPGDGTTIIEGLIQL